MGAIWLPGFGLIGGGIRSPKTPACSVIYSNLDKFSYIESCICKSACRSVSSMSVRKAKHSSPLFSR